MKQSKSSPIKGRVITGLVKLFALLPFKSGRVIASLLAKIFFVFAKKTKKVCLTNIKKCFPNLDEKQQKQMAKQVIVNMAMTSVEAAQLWQWPAKKISKIKVEYENEHLLYEAIEQKKGVICALPHIGCWEYFNHFILSRTPAVGLYRQPKIKQLDAIIQKSRQRTGAIMLPATAAGAKELFRRLKQKEILVILPDQEPAGTGGEFAPFFGHEAWSMTFLSRMAQKTKAVVLLTAVIRTQAGFKVILRPVDEGIYDSSLRKSLAVLNSSIENIVNEYPEQYQWTYKRFKTQPEGSESFY